MRVCPQCGDYYDDDGPPFCTGDGSALVNVDAKSDTWQDGERVLEEKGRVIRQRLRKARRRRIFSIVVTSVLVVMIVYVVASNAMLYFKPLDPDVEDAPTPSPVAGITITPSPTPTPSPACTASDQEIERQVIKGRYSEEFTARVVNDSTAVIRSKVPPGTSWVEPRLVEPTTEVTFSNTCTTATITITYKWQVLATINGEPKPLLVDGKHHFQCSKARSLWRCN